MKKDISKLNKFREKTGQFASRNSWGCNGLFHIPHKGKTLSVIVSDEMGWDHASVSVVGSQSPPTWDQMCHIKQLFWNDDEAVIQYHPPRSDYVNIHQGCLHMWRPQSADLPMPPLMMV